MAVRVEDDFDEVFYEMILPEVQGYYEGSQLSKRERYYHHYLNHGQHLYKNRADAEAKLFGDIKIKDDFNEDLHEKRYPEVKQYMAGKLSELLSKRKIYYHHYSNHCVPKCDIADIGLKDYLDKIKKNLFETNYEKYEGAVALVNHVSNPYGATHYLLNLFNILKKQGIKVCLVDEIINEKLYEKYNIDRSDVISYEQDLLLLCYIYEKIKPKIFYLNSIRGIFVEFLKLKNSNVITHSHEIADVYGRYDLLPTYVVSERIQKEFEKTYNYKPKIQPPIFSKETLDMIDAEILKQPPVITNNYGKLNNSKITLGMCGQTEDRKNPELFIELSKKYLNYNFLWVGGDKNKFPSINNLYHIPVVDLPFVYYTLMDYFILLSKEDPCPYVVLENLYINNKIITFKQNIFTNHNCELVKNLYFEFDGNISLNNASYMIEKHVKEKAKREGNGKRYILKNYTKLNEKMINVF